MTESANTDARGAFLFTTRQYAKKFTEPAVITILFIMLSAVAGWFYENFVRGVNFNDVMIVSGIALIIYLPISFTSIAVGRPFFFVRLFAKHKRYFFVIAFALVGLTAIFFLMAEALRFD